MKKPQELGWAQEDLSPSDKIKNTEMAIFQFVTPSEEYITWDIMLERAQEVESMYSIENAQDLLENQNKLIPSEWRGYNILFPGTRFLTATNQWVCPYIKYKDDQWVLDYHWYLFDFHHKDRFIISLKKISEWIV